MTNPPFYDIIVPISNGNPIGGQTMYQVVKHDGNIVTFDISKIIAAITKAYEAQEAQRSEVELSNYHEYVQIMAEFEWPAFLEYDPKFHRQIIDCMNNTDVDAFHHLIEQHFGVPFISELEEKCLSSPILTKSRQAPLEEAFTLYRTGHYFGAVAILMTQLEGILGDIEKFLKREGFHPNPKNEDLLSTRYKTSSTSEKGRMIKIILEAMDLDDVVGEYSYLIGYIRFKVLGGTLSQSEQGVHANRHLICHGKQTAFGTKEHALKIFLCLDSLMKVANVILERHDGPQLISA